jgi:DNA topoisomerase I
VGVSELHVVDPNQPGIRRRRAGRGFTYVHPNGRTVRDPQTRARIEALVIPPAWHDVWISPDPRGHIQAVGTDDRGRRQYRYHDEWRAERDREKFDRVVDLARLLPRLRRRVTRDLRREGLDRSRVLAAAIRLLERGLFRVGGEAYAEDNSSYGLATLQKRHVQVRDGRLHFDYPAKSGQRRRIAIDDPDLVPVVEALKARRRGGPELLAYKDERGHWVDVRSHDINDYLHAAVGGDFSAKDVRTWGGTVLAAVALAAESAGGGSSGTARRRREAHAMRWVSEQLGNTPAVARSSYVDPRVITSYETGITLDVEDVDPDRLGSPGSGGEEELVEEEVEVVEGAVIELIEQQAGTDDDVSTS